MAIVRKLLAHSDNQTVQQLKIDSIGRFAENHSKEWQFLFGPNSELTNSAQIFKLAAQLDTATLDKVRIIGYLYNTFTGAVDNAESVTFNVYRVEDINTPNWNDFFITTLTGTIQTNNYFFVDVNISALIGASLDGDTTLMIEGVATRLGITYRERIYVNHLGIYDSFIRLKNEVEFLDITKQDE